MNDITYDIMYDIMYVGCQVDEGDGADALLLTRKVTLVPVHWGSDYSDIQHCRP